jgi:hypothetical protein
MHTPAPFDELIQGWVASLPSEIQNIVLLYACRHPSAIIVKDNAKYICDFKFISFNLPWKIYLLGRSPEPKRLCHSSNCERCVNRRKYWHLIRNQTAAIKEICSQRPNCSGWELSVSMYNISLRQEVPQEIPQENNVKHTHTRYRLDNRQIKKQKQQQYRSQKHNNRGMKRRMG